MDEHREKLLSMSEQQFREFMYDQLAAGKEQFEQLHNALSINTALTKANIESTAELVEIFKVAKTGASFFAWCGRTLGRLARWAAPIITVGAAIWALKNGHLPRWGDQ